MKNFDELLRKYWKGNTELDEEQKLKEHFSENEKSQIEDEYFNYLIHKRKEKLISPGFDEEILRQINGKQGVERSLFQKVNWQIAAAILILFTAGILFINRESDPDGAINPSEQIVLVDTYEDPEIAFEETKKTLLLISSKLNKSSEYTAEFRKFSKSQEDLKKEN